MKRKKDVSMFLMLNRGGGCITLPTEEDKKKTYPRNIQAKFTFK